MPKCRPHCGQLPSVAFQVSSMPRKGQTSMPEGSILSAGLQPKRFITNVALGYRARQASPKPPTKAFNLDAQRRPTATGNRHHGVISGHAQAGCHADPGKSLPRYQIRHGPPSRGESGLSDRDTASHGQWLSIQTPNAPDRRRPLMPAIYIGHHCPNAIYGLRNIDADAESVHARGFSWFWKSNTACEPEYCLHLPPPISQTCSACACFNLWSQSMS